MFNRFILILVFPQQIRIYYESELDLQLRNSAQ